MVRRRLLKKVNAGRTDEKQAIRYYKGFTKEELEALTPEEQRNILDAAKDEKEHLAYLNKDKRTILGKRNRY